MIMVDLPFLFDETKIYSCSKGFHQSLFAKKLKHRCLCLRENRHVA